MQLEKYYSSGRENSVYIEKTFKGSPEEYMEVLKNSKTVYVSDVDENIKEERLWHLFSIAGDIKRVIMGVNRARLTFSGFFFVEYTTVEAAERAIQFFKHFRLDGKLIKIDKDMGFSEGRQLGRGAFGGMIKNDNRKKRRY
ncbi:Nuclear cap-binding protein subunit 2 [Glugoides intestinalis]